MAELEPSVVLKLAVIAAAGSADRAIAQFSEQASGLQLLSERLPPALRERAIEAMAAARSGLTGSLSDLLADLPEEVIDQLASTGDVPGEARRMVEESLPGIRDDLAEKVRELLERARGDSDDDAPPGPKKDL